MSADKFCSQCGAEVPEGVRFCVMCGAPVSAAAAPLPPQAPSPPPQVARRERTIGHLPVEQVEEGAGIFGRRKSTQLNMVITTARLLYLRETNDMNENWLFETERLEELQKRSGLPWRTVMDHYDFQGPLWASFYDDPPDELLAAHRHNEAVSLADIVSATITLEEELDKLDIQLSSGEMHHFSLYNQVGQPAARFLAQALGAERVRLTAIAES
jgi:hypothetical protein